MPDLRWGDILVAAIDACCVVGAEQTVTDDDIVRCLRELTERSGGMEGARGSVNVLALRKMGMGE